VTPLDTSEGTNLRDYLAVVWRRKWLVLLVIVLATGGAYAFSALQTSMYEAESQLIYRAPSMRRIRSPVTTYIDPSLRTVELESVATVIAVLSSRGTRRLLSSAASGSDR